MAKTVVLLGIFDDKGKILIEGDETRAAYLRWLSVESLQFGYGRNVATANRGTLDPGDIVLSRKMDAATVVLAESSNFGKQFTARIVLIEVIGLGYWREYTRYEFKGASVTHYAVSSGGDSPMMSFNVNHAGGTVKVG